MGWIGDYSIAVLQRRPLWVRLIIGLARTVNPIIKLGDSLFVLRAPDVREILERASEFEIGFANSPKMLQGEFLLGMDPSWPRYHEYRRELADVLAKRRAEFRAAYKNESEKHFNKILCDGRGVIDFVQDFAEPIVVKIVERVYGISAPLKSDLFSAAKDHQRLGHLLRAVGSVIAFTSPAPFGRQRIADLASKELKQHLDALIETRRQAILGGQDPQDTVMDDLVFNELQRFECFDADVVRAKLAGLVLAGSTAIIKAFSHAMHQFLKGDMGGSDREPLKLAIDEANASRREGVERLVFEALRFNPTFPIITRFCPRSTTIASGTPHGCEVPAGATVVPVLISAMFDESATPSPESFGYQRSDDDYLHFGHGQHECLGKQIATDALVEMSLCALRWPGLLQAAGAKVLKYDGVAVESFVVQKR